MKKTVSKNWRKYWKACEKFIFISLLFINILPVAGVRYFLTGDGPSHLYNSNIIAQLILDPGSRISDFFQLRHALIPNLGGHFLLTLFNSLLPANQAEKIVYALCLLLLPLGFRYFLKMLREEAVMFSILVFPFIHNFCFYIGFQGFCLGMAFMLFSFGYFFKTLRSARLKNYVLLGLLLFCTALFHLFPALIALMGMIIFTLAESLRERTFNFRKWWPISLALLPAIIFCLYFVFENSQGFHFSQNGFWESAKGLLMGIPLITINTSEVVYSYTLNVLVALAIGAILFQRFRDHSGFGNTDFLIILGLLLVLLYFVIPTQLASGGFISRRLLLSAYIFTVLWIALNLRMKIITLIFLLALVVFNGKQVFYHWNVARGLSKDAEEISEAARYIPEQSTVVPLNYGYHWLEYNIGLYLGAERKLIVLDNYEASTVHFPVQWKKKAYPGDRLGDFAFTKRPLLKIKPYEDFAHQRINAVVRWKHDRTINDPATLKTDSLLSAAFHQVYRSENGDVEVYLRKK